MKIIDCEQGSAEWLAARLGRPTASCFDKIVTPTGKLSASSDRYLARLVAEWYIGQPIDDVTSEYMTRGSAMEAEAVDWYEFELDAKTRKVGFCVTDDERCGASPDRLVGDDGLLEIKCPSIEVHASYWLGGIANEYRVQVQGQLWVTGREWCDLVSYNPSLPRVRVRFVRDADFIADLAKAVGAFCDRLDKAKARVHEQREQRQTALAEASADSPF